MADRLETITFDDKNKKRLDIFLKSSLNEFTRSRIQGLIRHGFVTVNKLTVTKPSRELESGERIEVRIPHPAPSTLFPENIPLDIIFENSDLLVVNKPAGMVVHPSPGHEKGTLVHAVLGHVPEIEGIGSEERPGIVHRLDKDTSGLIVIAKNERSHQWLQEQFKERSVVKTYLALVDGRPPTSTGRVEAPIGRHTTHRKLMAVVPIAKGREAISEYRTVENFQNHTLLEIHPLTGRTHQIRVHMAFLDCPIAGDTVYGKRNSSIKTARQFLHAHQLSITLPGEKVPRVFIAPLPGELNAILVFLRQQ
jgi:23S rRNA pseudouridine1911/1915/1917 synthase